VTLPLVMGVLNVTPDSFSDGGRYLDRDAAIEHGLALFDEGADIVDVGGESTRPGAEPVPGEEELRRVVPVIEALASRGRVSIDTRHAEVAEAAVAAGATLINDVSSQLAQVASATGAGYVAMHMLGDPRTMQVDPRYDDVVAEVRDFLVATAQGAAARGVAEVWIDPGLGFGKTGAHNLELLARLGELVARVDVPVLVGPSRKSFIARVLGDDLVARDDGTLATAVWAVDHGARIVRVHDAGAAADALRLLAVMDTIDAEAVA
jgi:dihydropteroate synthase